MPRVIDRLTPTRGKHLLRERGQVERCSERGHCPLPVVLHPLPELLQHGRVGGIPRQVGGLPRVLVQVEQHHLFPVLRLVGALRVETYEV